MSGSDRPTPHNSCLLCGAPLSGGMLLGHCSRCLMSLATNIQLEADTLETTGLLGLLQLRRLGDYELIEEIARGGMGIVYRARQISLNREVAVKMILSGELADETVLRMFHTEAQAAANLHHPHIVAVFESGQHEMQHYFSMQFVPGGRTIADWAADKRHDCLSIAMETARVARAVAHAHERGVLHRDLKPTNILWHDTNGPMVTDFGLARIQDSADSRLSRTLFMAGSPSYMAPEQLMGSPDRITTVTDVYGLGAVLYELLSGQPPFVGRSLMETARRVSETSVKPLPAHVPADLRTICGKCLAKKPEDRYTSAAELAEDLERFTRGEPVKARPLDAGQRFVRWARRKPALAGLAALLVLTFWLGFAGVLWQWREAEVARQRQAEALERLRWQQIDRWLNEDETSRALAYLAAEIRRDPKNWRAVMYAMSIVEQNVFPVLAGPPISPPSPLTLGCVCLSAKGQWLAAAGQDQVLRVWESETGLEKLTEAQSSPITAMDAADLLATAHHDGSLWLRDGPAGTPRRLTRVHKKPITQLLFTWSGTCLIARSSDAVEVWSHLDSSSPPRVFKLPDGILSASLDQKGEKLLAWNAREAKVWQLSTSAESAHMKAEKRFRYGTLSALGQRVALLDGDMRARLWDLPTTTELPAIPSKLSRWTKLALNAEGSRLTVMGVGTNLEVYDVAAATRISPPMRHHYSITQLISTANGDRTFSYGWDDLVRGWDSSTGHSMMTPIWSGKVRLRADLDLTASGDRLLVHYPADRDAPQSLSVWRWTQRRSPRLHELSAQEEISLGSLSADGRLAALSSDSSSRSQVYEIETGKVLLDVAEQGEVYVHLFSPDQKRCYALTANGWLSGWNLENGQPLWPPVQYPGKIRPATISRDGKIILSGHTDGKIRVHETATGRLLQALDHPGEVKTLHFAPSSNNRFVSGSTDTQAHVWDLSTGRRERSFIGHQNTIISAAWSPDARFIATASYDTSVCVWDVFTGERVAPPMQHLAWLSHVEFSPDGSLLASACRDGTARLWNPLTGRPASPPLLQGDSAETVRFTTDGRCLLVRDQSGFRFWSTDKTEPVTVHYPEPEASSIGMDSESYRAIMTPDGQRVFLANSMNYAATWSVPQSRLPAPSWFPDFLEGLGMMALDEDGASKLVPANILRQIPSRIQPEDAYADWARSVLANEAKK